LNYLFVRLTLVFIAEEIPGGGQANEKVLCTLEILIALSHTLTCEA
jgi:hypothetical protein